MLLMQSLEYSAFSRFLFEVAESLDRLNMKVPGELQSSPQLACSEVANSKVVTSEVVNSSSSGSQVSYYYQRRNSTLLRFSVFSLAVRS